MINKWQKSQDVTLEKYLRTGNPVGVFSYKGMKSAERLGEILKENIKGSCLDIGCGMLPRPAYMCEGIDWYGVDPLDDGKEKDFKFKKAMAEKLPYEDNSFDNVLFATSLDHVVDIEKTLKEAIRVLKKDGLIILWQFVIPERSYQEWQQTGEWFNQFHPFAFSHRRILEMFKDNKLIYLESIAVAENVYIFKI